MTPPPPPSGPTTVFGIEVLTFAGYAVSIVLLWGYAIALWCGTLLMRSRLKKHQTTTSAK